MSSLQFMLSPPTLLSYEGTWTDEVKKADVVLFRAALESLIGASSKEDLEAAKRYMETHYHTKQAELDAVNLLLDTIE